MTKTIRQILLPAALLAAAMTLLAAAPVSAGWLDVLRDCTRNDPIQGTYTKKELQDAKRHVTGERIAYTECMAEISAAIGKLDAKDGDDSDGGSDSGADLNGDGVVTPAEKRAVKKKKERQAQNVASVNDTLKPDSDTAGTIGGGDSSGGSGLPLILAIVLAVLLAAAGGTWYAAQRNPEIANALRRVPLPGRRG